MNNLMSLISPFNLAIECSGVLPVEIINKIFMDYNVLETPTAVLIKNHMEVNYLIEYTQMEYYIKYEKVSPDTITESCLDFQFIHLELESIYEQKYFELWYEELLNINPIAILG